MALHHEIRLIPNSRSVDNGARRIVDLARASWVISREPLDVMLFPAIYSFVPVLSRAKVMIILHDATAEMLPEMALHNRTARVLWNLKVAIGKWQADSLIAVSEYARQQVNEYLGVSPKQVSIVGEAPASVFRPIPQSQLNYGKLAALGIKPGRKAVVHLGGFSPHKNLFYLVQEFQSLVETPTYSDVDLFLVGDTGSDAFHSCYEELVAEVKKRGLGDRVHFTGFVADELLVELLNVAAITVIPSLNEGFGLPAVEAAACGCPVVATIASPLPTILGAGAIYINPRAQGALRDALGRLLSSPELRCATGRAGRQAAAKLSWKSEADRLLAAIQSLAHQ